MTDEPREPDHADEDEELSIGQMPMPSGIPWPTPAVNIRALGETQPVPDESTGPPEETPGDAPGDAPRATPEDASDATPTGPGPTPGSAEGDRETVEEDLREKGLD